VIRRRGRKSKGAWDDEGEGSSRQVPGRPGSSGAAGASRPSRTQRILGRHPVFSILGILATLTLTLISLTAYAAYRNVYDSIHHVTVTSGELGNHRPPKLDGSTNILIIGSDSRAGTHGRYGHDIPGARSDTDMLLHIPPNHNGAFVVSFPRDTMVPIFQCDAAGKGDPGQQAQPGNVEQLNATFALGGPACLWKTLEQVTHIHIDHFIEVNFLSFRKIVHDIGGVPVCLPYAIDDPASGLHLSAGMHTVDGTQALAFVRERHIGEGSDLQRINRQQIFLAALAQKIKQSDSLSNPAKLYGLVHDIASSLTTDSGLSFNDMLAIADSMKGISTSSLKFITSPVEDYPPNPGVQVEFWQPYANRLFRAIASDNRILKVAQEANKRSSGAPTVSPGDVHVQVLNATNTPGLAATTASQLRGRGFKVAGTGNASGSKSTVIEYQSVSQLPEASTLQDEITGARLKQVSSLKSTSTLNLILGSSFKGLASPHKAKSGKQPSSKVSRVVKEIGSTTPGGGVSGNINICHDKSAFAGPDNPSMFANG
jgi:LCP family protein required for cell wall assembly